MIKICITLFLFSDSWAKAFSETRSFLSLWILTQPTMKSGFKLTFQRHMELGLCCTLSPRSYPTPLSSFMYHSLALCTTHCQWTASCSRWESFLGLLWGISSWRRAWTTLNCSTSEPTAIVNHHASWSGRQHSCYNEESQMVQGPQGI